MTPVPPPPGSAPKRWIVPPPPGVGAAAGAVLAVAGLVLSGVDHMRLLHDAAIGLVVVGLLLIVLAIEGFGEQVQKRIIDRNRRNGKGL